MRYINAVTRLDGDCFQYYFSNWVDGLNPNPDICSENRANDWLVWLNVGYIYYLHREKSKPQLKIIFGIFDSL
jgi:hypothetical protein